MKNKISSFGHIWSEGYGINKKYFYCYKDSRDFNQHSRSFESLELCSQDFAQKFAEYIVRGMNEWVESTND